MQKSFHNMLSISFISWTYGNFSSWHGILVTKKKNIIKLDL